MYLSAIYMHIKYDFTPTFPLDLPAVFVDLCQRPLYFIKQICILMHIIYYIEHITQI